MSESNSEEIRTHVDENADSDDRVRLDEPERDEPEVDENAAPAVTPPGEPAPTNDSDSESDSGSEGASDGDATAE